MIFRNDNGHDTNTIQYWIIAVTLGGSTFPYTKWPRPNLTPHTTFSCPACDQSFKGFFCQVQNGLNICLLDDVETRQRLPVVFSTEKCGDVMWVRLFTQVAETNQVLKKTIVNHLILIWWMWLAFLLVYGESPKQKESLIQAHQAYRGLDTNLGWNHIHPFPKFGSTRINMHNGIRVMLLSNRTLRGTAVRTPGIQFLLMYFKKNT